MAMKTRFYEEDIESMIVTTQREMDSKHQARTAAASGGERNPFYSAPGMGEFRPYEEVEGQQQQQQHRRTDRVYAKLSQAERDEIDKEIEKIEQDTEEVAGMFQEVAELVSSHQDGLDRITEHIESAVENSSKGVRELEKAEERQPGGCVLS